MRERSQPVSFRLSTTFAKQLADRAAAQHESLGAHARRLVVEALNDTDRERLHEEVAELRRVLVALREDIATSVAALLVRAGKTDAREAQEWVRKMLLH